VGVAYPVIRFQIVNLFSEYQRPHVLAEEFDHIQSIREPRAISGEPVQCASRLALLSLRRSPSRTLMCICICLRKFPTVRQVPARLDTLAFPIFGMQSPSVHPRRYA